MDISSMTARRPYLLRAFYDWLTENELTPHLVVDATLPGVRVPEEYIQDGEIILNVASRAVGNLEIGNEALSFHARFGGRPHSVIVPIYAVQAIYARENGAGTMFEPEDAYAEQCDDDPAYHMKMDEILELLDSPEEFAQKNASKDDDPDDEPPRPKKGRPTLKVVK
jgi:stringent starvation protein B